MRAWRKGARPVTVRSYLNRVRIFAAWCVAEGMRRRRTRPGGRTDMRAASGRASRRRRSFSRKTNLAQLVAAHRSRRGREGRARRSRGSVLAATRCPSRRAPGFASAKCARSGGATYTLRAEGRGRLVRARRQLRGAHDQERARTAVPLVGEALRRAPSSPRGRRAPMPRRSSSRRAAAGCWPAITSPGASARYVRAARLRDGDHHNFHSLRHTFGTHAVSRGVDVYRLKEIMGHASIEVTQRYARLRPRDLSRRDGAGVRRAMERPCGACQRGRKRRQCGPCTDRISDACS